MHRGAVPFEGQAPSDVLAAILEREPPPVSRYASEVPEALAWVVTKALTKEREERYQTAREMLADVRRLRQRLEGAAALERSVPPPSDTGATVGESRGGGAREALHRSVPPPSDTGATVAASRSVVALAAVEPAPLPTNAAYLVRAR